MLQPAATSAQSTLALAATAAGGTAENLQIPEGFAALLALGMPIETGEAAEPATTIAEGAVGPRQAGAANGKPGGKILPDALPGGEVTAGYLSTLLGIDQKSAPEASNTMATSTAAAVETVPSALPFALPIPAVMATAARIEITAAQPAASSAAATVRPNNAPLTQALTAPPPTAAATLLRQPIAIPQPQAPQVLADTTAVAAPKPLQPISLAATAPEAAPTIAPIAAQPSQNVIAASLATAATPLKLPEVSLLPAAAPPAAVAMQMTAALPREVETSQPVEVKAAAVVTPVLTTLRAAEAATVIAPSAPLSPKAGTPAQAEPEVAVSAVAARQPSPAAPATPATKNTAPVIEATTTPTRQAAVAPASASTVSAPATPAPAMPAPHAATATAMAAPATVEPEAHATPTQPTPTGPAPVRARVTAAPTPATQKVASASPTSLPATPAAAIDPVKPIAAELQPVLALRDAQPSVQTSANAPVTTPATAASPTGHDFGALVDRLVEARDTAMPQTVRAAIRHADFGQVTLNFQADDARLSVSMTSADPDFAPAVQAAAAMQAGTSTDNGSNHQRQDAQQSQSQTQAQSQGSARGGERERTETARQPDSKESTHAEDEKRPGGHGGIFA